MENDLIRRSDALTEFEKVCNVCVALVARPMCDECSVADTVRTVKHIPAVDAEPVVRCKDCIWFRTIEGFNYCKQWYGFITDENGFCHEADKKVTENG